MTKTQLPYAVVDLKKEHFETWGANSLEGICFNLGIVAPQPVRLRFQQKSQGWCRENGGPDLYIVPEFMPLCLVDSILRMTALGFQFDIERIDEKEESL